MASSKITVTPEIHNLIENSFDYLNSTLNTGFCFDKDMSEARDIMNLLKERDKKQKKNEVETESTASKEEKRGLSPQSKENLQNKTTQNQPTFSSIKEIKNAVNTCQLCVLAVRRKSYIDFGGALNNLMIIADIPGYYDEVLGKVFRDRSGELLDKILKAVNISRENIYITSCIKCTSTSEPGEKLKEYMPCKRYIENEIKIVNPKLIIGFSETAFRFFFPEKNFKAWRGRIINLMGYNAFFTYHPRDLLFDERLKKPAWEDIKKHLL